MYCIDTIDDDLNDLLRYLRTVNLKQHAVFGCHHNI